MQNTQKKVKELDKSELEKLSKEALQILEILDQIESHTADLRNRLLEELKQNNENKVNLKLDNV